MMGGEHRHDPADRGPSENFPGPLWAFAITISASFFSILVAALFGPQINLGTLGIGQAVGFATVGALATQRIPAPREERLGLRGVERSFLPLLLLLLPLVFITSELDNVMRDLTPPPAAELEAGVEGEVQAAVEAETEPAVEVVKIEDLSPYTVVQQVIVIVGLAPVLEEWLFRGIVLQGLMSTMGRVPGLMLTSMLFAFASMVPGASPATVPAYLLITFLHGVVFGIVRIASGSLLAAMLVHAAFNAISLSAFYLTDRVPIAGFNVPDSHTPWSILAPCLLASGFALMRLVGRFDDVREVIPTAPDDDQRAH